MFRLPIAVSFFVEIYVDSPLKLFLDDFCAFYLYWEVDRRYGHDSKETHLGHVLIYLG